MRRADRILVAIAFGCAAAILVYAAARVLERAAFSEPNPALLIWSERSSFVWRSAIALYAGVMGAFGGHALVTRSPSVSGRALRLVIAAAITAIAAQGALAP
jgi:hypothetical protein